MCPVGQSGAWVSSLYIQAAGHNMLIIITWCFICFLILDNVCVWPVSTTFRHCGPRLLQTALAVMRLIGLANREHAVSSVTGPPHTHPQNMLRKCCHLISNKVWPIRTAHLPTGQKRCHMSGTNHSLHVRMWMVMLSLLTIVHGGNWLTLIAVISLVVTVYDALAGLLQSVTHTVHCPIKMLLSISGPWPSQHS